MADGRLSHGSRTTQKTNTRASVVDNSSPQPPPSWLLYVNQGIGDYVVPNHGNISWHVNQKNYHMLFRFHLHFFFFLLQVSYRYSTRKGLSTKFLCVFDLEVPEDFIPYNGDGEVCLYLYWLGGGRYLCIMFFFHVCSYKHYCMFNLRYVGSRDKP